MPMTQLHTTSLTPFERTQLKQFDTYIRKTYGMSLATFLLLELEDGRAFVLERSSVEYKGMMRWQ